MILLWLDPAQSPLYRTKWKTISLLIKSESASKMVVCPLELRGLLAQDASKTPEERYVNTKENSFHMIAKQIREGNIKTVL